MGGLAVVVEVALFGAAMGAAAMLSELPSSLLKRQAGVSSGAPVGGSDLGYNAK